jgi:ATPase subunit of ABC transporter with duplicated ATPase domains
MPPFLRAHRVAFAWPGAPEPLFSDVQFHLTAGWTGLSGGNGAGKTTLLRLVAGELEPSSGHLERSGRVHLCTQSVDEPQGAVRALAAASDGAGRRLLGELRLDPARVGEWATLSPGERRRWQVAAALWEEPDVLLLDEPTNHLDGSARRWLLGALERFRGVGLVVSHDRALLDALTTSTLRLNGGAARLWPGAYGAAHREWEREAAERAGVRRARMERRDALARELDFQRRAQRQASAATSAGRRMKGPRDSDARGMGADFRVAQAEKRLGHRVGALRRALARAEEAAEEVTVEPELGARLRVDFRPSPTPVIASAATSGGRMVTVRREDRLHIAGDNGAGKTTLMRALVEGCRIPLERLLYLPQDLTAAEGVEAVMEIRAMPADRRGRVLSIAGALGVDPERLLRTRQPSPGEARKALLARGLAEQRWALFLDEPTNHLDLPSIERLQAALAAYPGALVLITHDEGLAQACARDVLSLSR